MDGAEPAEAPASEALGTPVPEPRRDFTRAEALRTGAFWLVTLGISTQAMVGTGITFHIVDLGAEAGLSEAQAVAIFLPIALLTIPLGIASGMLLDRFPVRVVVMLMMVGECVMFFGATDLGHPLMRALAIAGWGVASGVYGPLMIAALPNFFGRGNLGAIQGFMMMCLVIASALGPAALALFRNLAGSYAPGLLALIALPALVLVAAPFTRDPQRSD